MKFFTKILKKSLFIIIPFLIMIGGEGVGFTAQSKILLESDRMENLQQGKILCFYENVKLKSDNTTVESNMMKSYEEKNLIVAEGNVRFRDTSNPEEVLTGTCHKMRYYHEKDYGELIGSPRLQYLNKKNPEDKIDVKGDKIKIFTDEKIAEIEGNVWIGFRNIIGESRYCTYSKNEDKIVLTGDPHVFEKAPETQSKYYGDKITLFISEDKVVIEENVKVTIENTEID